MRVMQRTLVTASLLCLLSALAGCNIDWVHEFSGHGNKNTSQDNTSQVANTAVSGLDVAVSNNDFATTYQRLQAAISGSATRQINLKDLASKPPSGSQDSVDIRPTRLILYQDASRTTPLINADPRAGLDLPPAILVYQDSNNDVGVAYDNGAYFKARYDVSGASDAVNALAGNAQSLAQTAAGNDVSVTGSVSGISVGKGIVSQGSNDDFPTTLNRLLDAINADNSLALIAQIDQRAAAVNVGLMLGNNDNRSTLVLFDAGQDVARLLSGGQTVGIDLPERMLVSEADDGTVTLYYNAPSYLVDRHQIKGRSNVVDALGKTLSNLANAATGK